MSEQAVILTILFNLTHANISLHFKHILSLVLPVDVHVIGLVEKLKQKLVNSLRSLKNTFQVRHSTRPPHKPISNPVIQITSLVIKKPS